MSDEETFESADANAADCTPLKAGDLRKGSFVVIKGKPCKVRAPVASRRLRARARARPPAVATARCATL